MTTETAAPEPAATRRTPWIVGLLPFIGIILFAAATIWQFAGGAGQDWGPTLVLNAVTYLIGWAGVGAGISHVFFSGHLSRSIGYAPSAFEKEVGFAGFGFGIAALCAGSFSPDYWFAVILASSVFRVGCGIWHVRSIIAERNYRINDTAILVVDFLVPASLLVAYALWAR